jgi:hypothetical protein
MAIIQISKIQVRSGNLVDLPQLDDGELGWATDNRRLFVGRTGSNIATENVEVLTSYSNISFSQINGSNGGNFNINNAQNGQLLTYVASTNTWENYSNGSTQLNGGKLKLGAVGNLSITGGAIGYVLETDGTGNLSWTPKGTLYTPIKALSNATPIIMTVANTVPYTNGTAVTITGSNGANANTIVNGKSFYVKLAVDYPTSGNVALYTDSGLSIAAAGTNLGASTPNVGVATSVIGSTGGGSGSVGGANTSVQFNDQNVSNGSASFTYDKNTTTLTVSSGNIVGANLSATTQVVAPTLVSNIATGTAPFTVTSTTRVTNLNAATSGVANTVNDAAQANITSVGTLTSLSSTGNITGANLTTGGLVTATGNVTGANLITGGLVTAVGNVIGGNIKTSNQFISTLATGTAPLAVSSTTRVANLNVATSGIANTVNDGAQPNITSVGTLTSLGVSGTVTASTFTSNVATGTAPLVVSSTTQVANLSVATAGTASTVTTNAQPNITSTGTLISLSVSGTAIVGNLSTAGNVITPNLTTGANTTAGNITGNWTLTTGSRLQATYADLAEYYEADEYYEPGTVLAFGGEKEVTLAEDGTARVAGVVSTDPAYAMNAKCPGKALAIALQGRVPTKVRGLIHKGDMMVSGGNGFARPSTSPQMGTVIGKALEDFDGIEGVIEVAVGRL